MPLFSIITVCYNSCNTIERTIKSILAQDFNDFEYIIVDGGSHDDTLNIIKKYEPMFQGRLKWKSELDNGIYDAMNKGIKRSTGQIIGIVNSDDWLEPNALGTVYYEYINNNRSLDVIYAGGMNFHRSDGRIAKLMPSESRLKKYAKIGDIAGVRHPATFVPKRVYDKYGIFDTRIKIAADTEFLLRFYYNGGKYIFIEKIITNMSDGGVSNTLSLKYIHHKMLPDKKLLMHNLKFPWYKRYIYVFLWLCTRYVKCIFVYLGIYRVR